ncbi:MBL fold metallo-hydrolase [Cryobacterium sp. PAMC25264]|uniref:MBL fold metallo-hydrolase n=1 Tax=Cryobacterium sp. PAMC25264 TaxID=2861288 RepID=UPI001C632F47|nr:MBL fold metallo-hydrolase [Cryobacterium sp. PAMC25264]QYF73216.1 MBL fold metallo-hydrolase [Cryobacterium sp. PAMC25264]
MSFWICATCGVEHADNAGVCAICADERQWVPAAGQQWTTLYDLHEAGTQARLLDLEPDLFGIESTPAVGIGQQAKLLCTPSGTVLWDPIGFVDNDIATQVLEHGPVRAVVASHPHMFGVQVEWSRALGHPPVLVAEVDLAWLARRDPVIQPWSSEVHLLPGVTLVQVGGHFPGSAVIHWADGAGGRGVLLSGDTVFANPDRSSVSFMRSYPNRLPLSGPVVERIARTLERFEFDRLYGNFDNMIAADARAIVRRSADRHWDWVRGDFDHLT